MKFEVCTFYKFVEMTPARVAELRTLLTDDAQRRGIHGLLLLSEEGCNATIAGESEPLREFKGFLTALPEFVDLTFKTSFADKQPFRRFKIDLRKEVVTFDGCNLAPGPGAAKKLSAKEWNDLIANDTDVVVLDTRNTYETDIGKFRGAVDPRITKFSQFPDFVRTAQIPKDKKILMYCTGGIRCEKASIDMQRLGYENVYQLSGGILKYFEECPDGLFDGECFVFDHRVAVDTNLQPSKQYKLCVHCGNPGREPLCCQKCGTEAVVCEHCRTLPFKQTCSKNCAHHLERKASLRTGTHARA